MDTRKWPWKKRSSERSGGESESSESISSHSERFSDEQRGSEESMKETRNDSTHSPEVTSYITVSDDEVKESMKSLAEKLSAALVNVSAKEDLVKQHAKVAEEAVAGWEKAENEVTALKQQLEAAVQQNLSLEVKNSHLDGALKECVVQLRQARDEQEKRASDGVVERNRELETKRAELEKRILDLEKENSLLKQELVSCYKELEVVRVERDFSTKSAETASKLQLDSIKKVAKLEAECRKLQSLVRKSPPLSNHKSLRGESLRSESGERVNSIISMDLDSSTDVDSWAPTLISEIDQFKSEKPSTKSLAANSLQIDMMDDFLEMERLVSLPEAKPNAPLAPLTDNPLKPESKSELDSMTKRVAHLETMLDKTEEQNSQLQNVLEATVDSLKAAHRRLEEVEIELNEAYKAKESLEFHLETAEVESRTLSSTIDSLKAEIVEERKLSAANSRLEELQNELNEANKAKESLSFQLNTMEDESRSFSSTIDSLKAEIEEERKSSAAQSAELRNALDQSLDSLKAAHAKIEEMQTELTEAYKSKESLESQLITMEAESRSLSSNLNAMKKEIEGERKLSAELKKKYEELENEVQEYEVQQSIHSNSEVKVKQEDLAMAADKLAECQQTIASLGRQLESLATLEDFFIDTSSIPGLGSDAGGEIWRLPSNGGACVSSYDGESYSILANGNKGSSSSSTNHVTAAKKWNSFPELFNRSKSGRT